MILVNQNSDSLKMQDFSEIIYVNKIQLYAHILHLHRIRYIRGDTCSTYTESGIYGEIRTLPTQNTVYTGRYVLAVGLFHEISLY